MFDLKEFNGTLVTEPYSVNSFDELERQILKEIAFYGSGLGWRSHCSNEVEKHYMLLPYVEKGSDETSKDYIKNLKFLVEGKIQYYRNCLTGTKPIKDFAWSLEEVADNKDFFALIVFKM